MIIMKMMRVATATPLRVKPYRVNHSKSPLYGTILPPHSPDMSDITSNLYTRWCYVITHF